MGRKLDRGGLSSLLSLPHVTARPVRSFLRSICARRTERRPTATGSLAGERTNARTGGTRLLAKYCSSCTYY